jgi:hypothetical protein
MKYLAGKDREEAWGHTEVKLDDDLSLAEGLQSEE